MSILYYFIKKCQILFKNLLLNLPFFIFCKKEFFENIVFLTDTVADFGRARYCVQALYFLRPMYMALGPNNFNRGKSITRDIGRGRSQKSRLFWSQMAFAFLVAISGPRKVLIFRTHLFQTLSTSMSSRLMYTVWICSSAQLPKLHSYTTLVHGPKNHMTPKQIVVQYRRFGLDRDIDRLEAIILIIHIEMVLIMVMIVLSLAGWLKNSTFDCVPFVLENNYPYGH